MSAQSKPAQVVSQSSHSDVEVSYPLPPADECEPIQVPNVEIIFRRSEDSVEDTPQRQMSGFMLGLFAAVFVGIVLFLVLTAYG